MFIQTETTADPAVIKFFPGRQVLATGTATFADPEAAAQSPLAARILAVDGVARVELDTAAITVTRADGSDWQLMKPAVLGAIMEHFTTGQPVMRDDGGETAEDEPEADEEVVATIEELIETRIRPVAAQEGGDVRLHSFKRGVVYLEMEGSAFALLGPIASMLRHYVPEITGVRDFRDSLPKPGLETPTGQAVQRLLNEMINPAVAGHGGHIALVDVKDDRVYIRLEGGCQGCGMADVTLKQGIETTIRRELPEIAAVLDVTDHAGGTNPYYQPSRK